MLNIEAQKFTEDILTGLWPNWRPTGKEQELWVRFLCRYDYSEARLAVEKWFEQAENPGSRPIMAKLRPHMVSAFEGRNDDTGGWVEVFRIGRPGSLAIPFVNRGMPSPSECEEQAQYWLERYKASYGGEWEITRTWEQAPSDPNDVVMGSEAKRLAEKRILDGPDTPGKRLLLARQAQPEGPAASVAEAKDRTSRLQDKAKAQREAENTKRCAEILEEIPF